MNRDNIAIEKNENVIYEIKRTARTDAILGICKWLPILLIVILFALPLVTIDITLGEIVIEQYEVSIFDFVFSHSNSETFQEEMLAEITAEFIGIEAESYNNFLSIFYAFGSNIKGSVEGVEDVLNIFKGMVFDFAFPIGSIFAIIFYVAASLICIFKYIKKAMVETALRRVDNNTFMRVFNNASRENTHRSFAYRGKMTSYIVKFLIGYFIAVFFFSYLPLQLVSFLDKYALVAVNPLWYFGFWGLLILHIVFLIIEYIFSIKKADVLNGCDYIKSIK